MRFVFLLVALVGGAAHAQRAPDMATLDRGDGISKLGLELAYTSFDSPTYDSTLRFELAGQYVLRSGVGFYGAFPIARSFGGADTPPDETFAIGNLDLGVLYTITRSPSLSWVFRGGLALPTASDDVDGAATNAFAVYPRPRRVLSAPRRVAADPRRQAVLDDVDDDGDFVTTLAFTLRFMLEKWQPFLSLDTPIDDVRDTAPFFFVTGVQVAP